MDSPGEENAAHHTDTVSFTKADFAKRVGLNPSGSHQSWFGNVTYTEGGGIDTIDICSVKFKGTELRQKLGVRSTAISFVPLGDTILVTTKGYGHRVGMSQYGAEAMAVSGSTYDLILQHYYPETTLTAHNPD